MLEGVIGVENSRAWMWYLLSASNRRLKIRPVVMLQQRRYPREGKLSLIHIFFYEKVEPILKEAIGREDVYKRQGQNIAYFVGGNRVQTAAKRI